MLAKYLKEKKAQSKTLQQRTFTVGFHDARISNLATLHEFGHRKSRLPERPAFRQALPEVRREWRKASRGVARAVATPGTARSLPDKRLRGAVLQARDTVKGSYLNFKGKPLGKVQQARKRGTVGEGKQLQGREGPRMIEHVEAREAGRGKVDD